MYLVAAFTHDARPYGSSKVATRDEAERAAERYMMNSRVGSVRVSKLLPAMTGGNGRYR